VNRETELELERPSRVPCSDLLGVAVEVMTVLTIGISCDCWLLQPAGWVEVRNPALGVMGLLGFRFASTQPGYLSL
jgi:hypothetical protein